jgi:stage V sporulation protein G
LATVNLNDSFALKGIKIMEGANGLFVHTPSYKDGDKYREHYFPTTKDFREQLHGAVMTAYNEAISQSQEAENQDNSEEPAIVQSM